MTMASAHLHPLSFHARISLASMQLVSSSLPEPQVVPPPEALLARGYARLMVLEMRFEVFFRKARNFGYAVLHRCCCDSSCLATHASPPIEQRPGMLMSRQSAFMRLRAQTCLAPRSMVLCFFPALNPEALTLGLIDLGNCLSGVLNSAFVHSRSRDVSTKTFRLLLEALHSPLTS